MKEIVDTSVVPLPSASDIKLEPESIPVKTLSRNEEKSDETPILHHESVVGSLNDSSTYITESKQTKLNDGQSGTVISHSNTVSTHSNILVAIQETPKTYQMPQSATVATTNNASSVVPELVSSMGCSKGSAEVAKGDLNDIRRPMKLEEPSKLDMKGASCLGKADGTKVVSSHLPVIDVHSQWNSTSNGSLSSILNVPLIPSGIKRQSPEKFVPIVSSSSNIYGGIHLHSISMGSSPSSSIESCSRSSSVTPTRPPYINGKPDMAVNSRSEHLHIGEQLSQNSFKTKRRCLEQCSISGSTDFGSTSTIVSPIKQFVDRARNRAISSSLQSKCLSSVDSSVASIPTRDSVLRYSSTERPQQAATNQPLDLSTKKPKFVSHDIHVNRSVPTISANCIQDEPLDLSKPIPRPLDTNRSRLYQPENSNHRNPAPMSDASITSPGNIRSSSSHRSAAESRHRSSAESHSSVVFSTSVSNLFYLMMHTFVAASDKK